MLIAAIFMIIISIVNYSLNEDYVTLGIFVFMGIAFVLLSIKNNYKDETIKRMNKYAMTFLFGASVIFFYWLVKVQFNLF